MDTHTLPPIACRPDAFDPAQRERYAALVAALRGWARALRETGDGFALTLPSDADACLAAMEFATLERRCCPFLTFRLELAPQDGPLTLTLGGPEGTKEVLADLVEALRGDEANR